MSTIHHARAGWSRVAALSAGMLAFGCSGVIGEPGAEPGSASPSPTRTPTPGDGTFTPPDFALPRLTNVQHRNSVEALTGIRIEAVGADDIVPAEVFAFTDEGAAIVGTSDLDVRRYQLAASEAATRLVARGDARDWAGCDPSDASDPCIDAFVRRFLRRAFRRPATDAEVTTYRELVTIAIDGDLGMDAGIAAVVRAALQSPHFLYRPEIEETNPGEVGRIERFSFASKLSYFLTDHPPDDALLDAAERNDLEDPALLAAEVERLLDTPEAEAAMWRHVDEWFAVSNVRNVARDEATFGVLPAELGQYLSADFEHRLRNGLGDADFMSVFTSREGLLNETLASIYGVEGVSGEELVAHRFDASSPYAGILTSPGFLALASTPVRTSAVRRGLYIRTRVLCGVVPPPPPTVNTTVEAPSRDAITQRDRLASHRENPACASCHEQMDPLGLTLEHFDALGRWRDDYHTVVDGEELTALLDVTGEVDGQAVDGGIELGQAIAEADSTRRCVSKMLYRRAFNTRDTSAQRPYLEALDAAFQSNGRRLSSLFAVVAESPEFRLYRAEE